MGAPRSAPFLDRYSDPLPIRSRAAFQILSAQRTSDGRACVLVLPGSNAAPRAAAEAFAEIERVHALVEHPLIPRVEARGEASGTPFLELACEAVVDGIEIVRLFADSDRKIPYGAADAFIASLREAMQAAHAVVDPFTGRPVCLGRMSAGNILFDARGRWWLVGFGRNFPVEKETGAIDGATAYFQAHELSSGGEPSPSGDYVALLLFMRSVMPYVDLATGPIGRILRGDVQPSDMELLDLLKQVELRVISEVPSRRATIAEAVEIADRIRAIVGAPLDRDGYAAFVESILRSADPSPLEGDTTPAVRTLTVGPDLAWIAGPDGKRSRLGRPARRIVGALVEHHRGGAAGALTTWDLLEAGWPGERPVAEAGANRVYVTLARLRQLGLRELIERNDDGFRIAAGTEIRESS